MTLHINYTHHCPQCETGYIPYDTEVPCPKCGNIEKERFDFISKAAESLQYNKEQDGSYTPGAWFVASLSDQILEYLFGIFDAYEDGPGEKTFSEFSKEIFSTWEWGDVDFYKDYVHGIAVRIHEELKRKATKD